MQPVRAGAMEIVRVAAREPAAIFQPRKASSENTEQPPRQREIFASGVSVYEQSASRFRPRPLRVRPDQRACGLKKKTSRRTARARKVHSPKIFLKTATDKRNDWCK